MLTDTEVKKASYVPKQSASGTLVGNVIQDRDGLFLFITPTGSKSFRFSYRFGLSRDPEKAKQGVPGRWTITYGKFPRLTLAEARKKHAEALERIAKGENPMVSRKREKYVTRSRGDDSFRGVGERWYTENAAKNSQSWRDNNSRWLKKEVYPAIGAFAMREVQAADIVPILERIMGRGNARSAELVRKMIGSIFDYAIGKLILEKGTNPARALGDFVNPPKPVSHPKLTPAEIPGFLAAIEAHECPKSTKLALKLLLHVFVRKGELINAAWVEFDLDGALWRIPASRTKNKVEHLVPLSSQAVAMLRELKKLAGDSPLVFPGHTKKPKPIHRGLLNVAIDSMGYKGRFSPHSARATAATVLCEAGWPSDVVDRQLGHVERDKVKGAYIRAEYMEERKRLLQAWSDMLDGYASGANVIPFKQNKTAGAA